MLNHWDTLNEKFNGHKDISLVDPDAADNILIAWPPMLDIIKKQFGNKKDISILDYGCGAGAFCEKLWTLGYKKISGMDSPNAMIEIAKKNYGDHINFISGSADTQLSITPVDIITGIMVFQFIADIETILKNLARQLKPNGLLIFAVHSDERVKILLQNQSTLFSNFDSTEKPAQGLIHLGPAAIPIFIRTAAEYNAIAATLGLTKISEEYPAFTPRFITQFGPVDIPSVPHFMVLGYVKKN